MGLVDLPRAESRHSFVSLVESVGHGHAPTTDSDQHSQHRATVETVRMRQNRARCPETKHYDEVVCERWSSEKRVVSNFWSAHSWTYLRSLTRARV